MDRMDFGQRNVDQDKIMQLYRSKGINQVVNYPITDENMETYCQQLLQGCHHLYDLLDAKKHRVYLHDTTGVSRAPTLFLCYRALYVKSGLPLRDMYKELKKQYPFAMPNLKAIRKVLDDNKAFHEKQKARFLEDEKRRKREEEEERMRANLKKQQDEAEL